MKDKTIWIIELQVKYNSLILAYLSTPSKLGQFSMDWTCSRCPAQAKQWKKHHNAHKWAAIGNKTIKKGYQWIVRPLKGAQAIQTNRNGRLIYDEKTQH